MSTAEERLDKLEHVVTVWEGREISKNQKYTVEACYAYDLAREAIALLRGIEEWLPCIEVGSIRDGVERDKYMEKRRKFLDGEP